MPSELTGARRDGPGLSALRRVGGWLQLLPRPAGAALALAWVGFIAWLSSLPSKDLPAPPFSAFVSNAAHAVLYGLLALWAALAAPRAGGWPRLDRRVLATILALVVAYGLIDEWHQASSPGRTPSLYDALTDLCGAAATLVVARYAGRADARERGLWLRLGLGVLACALAAGLATLGPDLGGV